MIEFLFIKRKPIASGFKFKGLMFVFGYYAYRYG